MIPRKRLDIGWLDILRGLSACAWSRSAESVAARLEHTFDRRRTAVACLSVRSGFDATLSALQLSPGDEVLVSAATIRDMPRIIEQHGLVPVPVDIDPATLAVSPAALQRAITPRTRAVLVAHLFGSRMPLESVVRVARERRLLVIEDCAQAFAGDDFRGHGDSDVCLFSFGPIKTATALGGAVLTFRDRHLAQLVRREQDNWSRQSRWQYGARLCKYAVLMLLSFRATFTLLVWACRLLDKNHDAVIGRNVRGFAGGDFFAKIRHRPAAPLLAVLARRLASYDAAQTSQRMARAHDAVGRLRNVARPGERAPSHTHWVFPILHARPDELVRHLWQHGFDGTRGASNMQAIDPPADRVAAAPTAAGEMFSRIVYLPLHAGVSPRDVDRLAAAIASFERHAPAVATAPVEPRRPSLREATTPRRATVRRGA